MPQPLITDSSGSRLFACSAAAVLGFIVDEDERILLLSHPARPGRWEVVNGALESGETLLDGVLREIHEEAGTQLIVRPLGTLHAHTFNYDAVVQYMISVAFVLAYEGGAVIPGDDMRGSQARWWRVDELSREAPHIVVPDNQPWLFARAVGLYRLWRTHSVALQPALSEHPQPKRTLAPPD
jgi:8-oxo-dGTP pyrophosphatase MutT (NUDIX family)